VGGLVIFFPGGPRGFVGGASGERAGPFPSPLVENPQILSGGAGSGAGGGGGGLGRTGTPGGEKKQKKVEGKGGGKRGGQVPKRGAFLGTGKKLQAQPREHLPTWFLAGGWGGEGGGPGGSAGGPTGGGKPGGSKRAATPFYFFHLTPGERFAGHPDFPGWGGKGRGGEGGKKNNKKNKKKQEGKKDRKKVGGSGGGGRWGCFL